jgi:hypothetical protein
MGIRVHPCFEIPALNQPISLGNQPARVRLRGESLEARLTAYVTATPPAVSFEAELPPYFGLDLTSEAEVTLVSNGVTIRCQILKGKMFSDGPSTIWLRPLQEVTQGALDAAVSSVVFVIPNFPSFFAHGIIQALPGGGWRREDEIRLHFDGWRVTIASVADIAERKAALADGGGFGITAVGVIERADGRSFTWDDVAPQVEALRVFLSFACGRWTGPMLPAGIGPTGEPVWFRWTVPLVDEGFYVFTWFDTHHGMALSDIAPGFMAKWNDPLWKEAFSYAIYWFVRANSAAAGADGSLILSQAALEALSWTCLVKTSVISRSRFKSLKAAGAIRKLLGALGIPSGVPVAMQPLLVLASTLDPADGASAIVAVRNSLVHPEKWPTVVPVTEAWMLAQRFVELVILRLCGFNGEYANRTNTFRWLGQVERVPWA